MKKLVLLLSYWVFILSFVNAQVPEGFNYQAIIRDLNGELLVNQDVGVRLSIIQEAAMVYTETHEATTNYMGLLNLVIGQGTSGGDFSEIDWSLGDYSIKIEVDPEGGTDYEEIGTDNLYAVPYAMFSQESGSNYLVLDSLLVTDHIQVGESSLIIMYETPCWIDPCFSWSNIYNDCNTLKLQCRPNSNYNTMINYDNNGFVGIGTCDPLSKLHVYAPAGEDPLRLEPCYKRMISIHYL